MTLTILPSGSTPQPTPLVPSSSSSSTPSIAGVSFGDVLDAVNPLQHIPIVSSLYRAATGTQISTASQVAGDTLYGTMLPGGAIAGLASSLANVAVKAVTGKDIGQQVVGAVAPSSASSNTTAATPLVPTNSTTLASAQTVNSISSLPLARSDHSIQVGNAQYKRAKIHDAVNGKLVKMAV